MKEKDIKFAAIYFKVSNKSGIYVALAGQT